MQSNPDLEENFKLTPV